MPTSFRSNRRLSTSLFDAFIKCADYSSAELIFSNLEKNVISYGNLMNGFNRGNQPDKTLNLFEQMKSASIEADVITYLCVIKALSQIGISSLSRRIVQDIPESFRLNRDIQNASIDLWVSGRTSPRFVRPRVLTCREKLV